MEQFVAAIAARRTGAFRLLLAVYPVQMMLLGVVAVIAGGPVHARAVLWGSLFGISVVFAMRWGYQAMAEGPVSVVAPLVAALNAAVPVVAGLALGERPGDVAMAGVVVAIVAVVLVSREDSDDEDARTHRFTLKVAWVTIAAGSLGGLASVVIYQAPVEGRFWSLFLSRVAATGLMLVMAATRPDLRLRSGGPIRLAVVVALLNTLAVVTLLMAMQAWSLSLASTVSSLFPAVTVVLAVVVLRERVTRWQWVGMAMVLVSGAMISGW